MSDEDLFENIWRQLEERGECNGLLLLFMPEGVSDWQWKHILAEVVAARAEAAGRQTYVTK